MRYRITFAIFVLLCSCDTRTDLNLCKNKKETVQLSVRGIQIIEDSKGKSKHAIIEIHLVNNSNTGIYFKSGFDSFYFKAYSGHSKLVEYAVTNSDNNVYHLAPSKRVMQTKLVRLDDPEKKDMVANKIVFDCNYYIRNDSGDFQAVQLIAEKEIQ